MDKQLLVQMEQLRTQMVETAHLKQNLLHHEVLIISESLDEIIIKVQVERKALRRAN